MFKIRFSFKGKEDPAGRLERFTKFKDELDKLVEQHGYSQYMIVVKEPGTTPNNPAYSSVVRSETLRAADEMGHSALKTIREYILNATPADWAARNGK